MEGGIVGGTASNGRTLVVVDIFPKSISLMVVSVVVDHGAFDCFHTWAF